MLSKDQFADYFLMIIEQQDKAVVCCPSCRGVAEIQDAMTLLVLKQLARGGIAAGGGSSISCSGCGQTHPAKAWFDASAQEACQ